MSQARIAIHAHFYQPDRDDPFTGRTPAEPSAAPFHDWNTRIAAESYRPNVEHRNVARIGWDLGPTLARWMRREERSLHDAWMAQDDGHNGMAQGFHHAILPLSSARDRRTEVRWGLRDFALRVGRPATGMWFPETAVDHLTLRIAAEEGVRWTILSPAQARTEVTVEHPRRIELGGGLSMGVLFYDAGLSTTVSFDPIATSNADQFARQFVRPRLDRAVAPVVRATRGGVAFGSAVIAPHQHAADDVVLIATDGELYGHHQQFRDLFLNRLLTVTEGMGATTPGAFMDSLDLATLQPVALRDPSSWSCSHGVMRWYGPCPDAVDGHWKRPLRQAFDRLAGALDIAVERWFGERGLDLWELRDAFADVASGLVEPEAWLEAQIGARVGAATGSRALAALDAGDRRRLLTLLHAVASRLQMFASDGWYWGDPRRLETAQVLRFAAFAARTVDAELGTALEQPLVADLAGVRAPDVPDEAVLHLVRLRTGDEIYRAALEAVGQPAPRG
jgi:Domain of unknown function (DUF3536)/Glycosyl hydrolase family 57